jgi:hypothetical protein
VLVSLLALGPEVASAAPRECGFKSFDPEFPPYARAGGVIDIPINDYSAGEDEFIGTVRVTPLDGEPQTYPLQVTDMRKASWGGFEGHVVVPAPARQDRATRVVLNWIERTTYGPGFTSECTATEAVTMPVVPSGGKVGDSSYPRLEGKFRVLYRLRASGIPGVPKRDSAIWSLRPRCRYFSCMTRVKSTLGLRGYFSTAAAPGGFYDYGLTKYLGRAGWCGVEIRSRFTGELIRRLKVRRAYRRTQEMKLAVAQDPRTQRVRSFTGKAVWHAEPIRSARRLGCPDKYVVERIRGELIGS